MPAARNYSSTAVATTVTSAVNNVATTIPIASATGYPTPPFGAVIDRDRPTEEAVLVTALVGLNATVTRGYDSTTAVAHDAAATFEHAVLAVDLRDAGIHVGNSSGVHGVTGSVVGTTDVQTMTNKTLTSPTITTPAVTGGTYSGGTLTGPTINGATVSGTFTGSPTVSGALTVTGNTSVGGTLTSTGTLTANAGGSLSGTFAGTPTFSGAVAMSSTLTVTGAASTGALTTTGTLTANNGGTLGGTFAGSPTLSGNPSFTGTPSFTNNPTSPAGGPYAAWQTYTPTFLGATGAAGTFAFVKVGKTLHVRGSFSAGTTNLNTVAATLPSGNTIAFANQAASCINTNGAWTAVPCQVRSNGVEFNKSNGTNFTNGDSIAGYVFYACVEVN